MPAMQQVPNKKVKQAKPGIIKKITWPVRISKIIGTLTLICALIIAGSVTALGLNINNRLNGQNGTLGDFNILSLVPAATGALTGQRNPIKGEAEGRTNYLLIGLDPDNGATDTIMLVSIFHPEKKLASINIPRDFYITDPNTGQTKINAIYPIMRNARGGSDLTATNYLVDFVAKEFKIPIHYWATVNINGLRQAIDTVGGVEVTVDCPFVDYEFPTDNYSGYIRPAPAFKAGTETMNGFRASIYARSRKAVSDQPGCLPGTDFDRSRRQSIVVQALLDKVKSTDIWDNFGKIDDYFKILGDNVKTNIPSDEIVSTGLLLKDYDIKNGFYRGVWQTGNGFLCAPENSGAGYIITYGNASSCGNVIGGTKTPSRFRTAAQDYVAQMLVESQKAELKNLRVRIVANTSTLAQTLAVELENQGYTITFDNRAAYLPRSSDSAVKNSNPTTSQSLSAPPAQPTPTVSVFTQNEKIREILKNNAKILSSTVSMNQTDNISDEVTQNLKNFNPQSEIIVVFG